MALQAEVSPNPAAQANEASASLRWGLLSIMVMLIGTAVRLRCYLVNDAFHRDEAAVALNVVHRSFGGLFRPLDNDQAAPVGFLLIEKLAVLLLGNHEYVLRLAPLAASILVLPLFFLLCRKILTPGGSVMALTVLALGAMQFKYSVDVKQYALDVFVTVALLCLGMTARGNLCRGVELSRRAWITLAIVGGAAIWFSHPAVFVLGGIGAMAAMEWRSAKPRTAAFPLAAVALTWMLSFALNYFSMLHPLGTEDYLRTFWVGEDAFAPLPTSINGLIWYKEHLFEIFELPLSMGFVGLCALVFALGVGKLWRRQRSVTLVLLLPIFLALVASIVHQYPFKERLILFICPLLAICIGAGCDYLFEWTPRTVGILAVIFLLIKPINQTRKYLTQPLLNDDLRSAASLVAQNRQDGDALYLYKFSYYPFLYYRDRFGVAQMPISRGGPLEVQGYRDVFAKMKGRRLWVMFDDEPQQQERATIVLDELGNRVYQANPYGVYLACYALR